MCDLNFYSFMNSSYPLIMMNPLLECALYSYTMETALLHDKLMDLKFKKKDLHIHRKLYKKDGHIVVHDIKNKKLVNKSEPDHNRNRSVIACRINVMDIIECHNVNTFMQEMGYTYCEELVLDGYKYYKGNLTIDLLKVEDKVEYVVHAYLWTTDLQEGEFILTNLSNEISEIIQLTKI
ncbi:putative Mediator complex, subunit Med18, metazoa/fungi protein [Trachipleistophora hominis]|uniref:Mediator of RNA polymerase II transcription subunit 18 n=1 Tax=Trachipleistophora hominis TaxID=72359 RepID=L7JU88_TRAHO|nr:putative Mediator complex, subunit Med18, metazoa/fungi protein [Trachipleistophora hominis]